MYALGAAVPAALYVAVWNSGMGGNALYDLVGLSAAAAILLGVRLNRPRRPWAWYLVAAGQLLFVTGDVVWATYEVVLGVVVPFPSWADGLYLAGYPALCTGVLLFAHARSAGRDRAALVDAAIVTTSAAAYTWMFLMEPYITDPSLSLGQRLVSIAYPLGDIAIVAVAARLVLLVRHRSRSYSALMASFLLLLVADINYGLQALLGTYTPGGITTDGFYLASYVLCGWAALHPDMTALTRSSTNERERSPRSRLLILTGGLLLVPAGIGLEAALGRPVSVAVAIGGSVALSLLVLTRMKGLVKDVEARIEQLKVQEGAVRAALTEKESLSEQLKHQVLHDPLTGVSNRLLLADRINHAVTRRQRTNEPFAILFLDLDDFKSVNDNFDHATGDAVLAAVANLLTKIVRPGDTVARIGGDEFALLLEGAQDKHAEAVARRIVEELALPLQAAGNMLVVHASIGIAMDETDDAEQVLKNADVAMYEAKTSGKGVYELFSPRMRSARLDHQHLRADLQRAIEQGELVVVYQPIVNLEDGAFVGAEALVRWIHPLRGTVFPSDIIPLAEETALIYDIDRFVLSEALRQVAVWRQQHEAAGDFKISVNVSPAHLQQSRFVEDVGELLEGFRLPGAALILEITETALLRHSGPLLERLQALKDAGVGLALDDFGTGFSSLSHLHRLPIDVLKIDKSFVDDVAERGRGRALAQAINFLGSRLGLVTVAEGVEGAEQVDLLREYGCLWAQGYFFSPPLPPAEIDDLFGRGRVQAEGASR